MIDAGIEKASRVPRSEALKKGSEGGQTTCPLALRQTLLKQLRRSCESRQQIQAKDLRIDNFLATLRGSFCCNFFPELHNYCILFQQPRKIYEKCSPSDGLDQQLQHTGVLTIPRVAAEGRDCTGTLICMILAGRG